MIAWVILALSTTDILFRIHKSNKFSFLLLFVFILKCMIVVAQMIIMPFYVTEGITRCLAQGKATCIFSCDLKTH